MLLQSSQQNYSIFCQPQATAGFFSVVIFLYNTYKTFVQGAALQSQGCLLIACDLCIKWQKESPASGQD
jgi:hypothetical protein